MKSVIKVYLYEDDEKFFGEGPYRLLKGVERLGSLRSSAIEQGMAYSKAFKLIKCAEEKLGFALTEKHVGGKEGGGSKLTDEAKEFIKKYEEFSKRANDDCAKLYSEIFCKH
jgi:molybdate transport system regulatory protein